MLEDGRGGDGEEFQGGEMSGGVEDGGVGELVAGGAGEREEFCGWVVSGFW